MTAKGHWRTRLGKREWIEAPRCDCGGELDSRRVRDPETALDNEVIGELFCLSCGSVRLRFLKPSQAAIERGRQLSAERGWKDVRP